MNPEISFFIVLFLITLFNGFVTPGVLNGEEGNTLYPPLGIYFSRVGEDNDVVGLVVVEIRRCRIGDCTEGGDGDDDAAAAGGGGGGEGNGNSGSCLWLFTSSSLVFIVIESRDCNNVGAGDGIGILVDVFNDLIKVLVEAVL